MKAYIIKIQADGITHTQVILDKEDLVVLKAILQKIEKDAENSILNGDKQ